MLKEEFNQKIKEVFSEVVINKHFALMREISRMPRYIGEYLLTKFDTKGEVDTKKLEDFVNKYYPEPADKNKVLFNLLKNGSCRIIDEFKVEVYVTQRSCRAIIPCLQIYDADVDNTIVEKHENLLRHGVWGLGTLELLYECNQTSDPAGINALINDSSPDIDLANKFKSYSIKIKLTEFTPYQLSIFDINDFILKRNKFATKEWIDLLMGSIGVEPSVYTREQKILILTRLIPLIENNVNMVEFGPRATGKTYLYRNTSYYSRLFSGGKITPAILFFNGTHKEVGEIGVRDCIIFDELSKTEFPNHQEIAGKLKDYMVDGFFERLTLKKGHSTCSLVFIENSEEIYSHEKCINLLPQPMRDTSFIDRIHGIIPGWILPKILQTDTHLYHGYGLATDYLGEFLHRFRSRDFQSIIEQKMKLVGNITIRDEKAIKKTSAGLLKLLYPHNKFTNDEFDEIIQVAIKLRQNVTNWLSYLSPIEFPKKEFGYKII